MVRAAGNYDVIRRFSTTKSYDFFLSQTTQVVTEPIKPVIPVRWFVTVAIQSVSLRQALSMKLGVVL